MKLLGVGHALVDVFVFGDEELPASLGFHLGSYNLVKAERMDSILATLEEPTGFPGGLAANVLRLSASLGVETNFYGVCADDHEGSLFAEGLKAGGVDAHLRTSGKRTGRSITFYTGGRRTIVTSRGISEDISQEDFGSAPIEETDWVFLEGFLMEQPQTFLYLLETAKAKGKKLAFDPGDLKIPPCIRIWSRSSWNLPSTS
jgi:sugar/nucleoside kinase (ribokinase family)